MPYFDTSIIVAFYCPEPVSNEAENLLRRAKDLYISPLVEVELASAVSRKVREKTLSITDAARIIAEFKTHVDQGIFHMVSISSIHFACAFNWIASFITPLRAFDAIHCAIASQINETIVTADASLAHSAKILHVNHKLLSRKHYN
jgi:predicted nucleic acid-binding protein